MMGIMCGTLGQKAMTSWPQIVPYKETHQNAGQGVESEIAVVGTDAKLTLSVPISCDPARSP